jgi:5-dehydro-2-deoxygluconokinase
VLWGLTRRGDGQTRFVPDAGVTASLQEMLPQFDLLIGTEEEFLIAGGVPGDLLASLRRVREITAAAMIVKLGPLGCCIIAGAVPARLEDAPTSAGERVEVLNVLGAGDAFAAGLLAGLLRGDDFAAAARIANACGAIVVSRHACAPAMPTPAELAYWFSGRRSANVASDAMLAHLHRTTAARAAWHELNVMAFDHRSQFFELARDAGAPESRIPLLKRLLVRAAEQVEASRELRGRVGVLVDEVYGEDAMHAATGRGWWVGRPVELPGSRPLRFDGGASLGTRLLQWPREQVVKCLVHYHPDDAVDLRLEQEARLHEVWAATRDSGHELLLEVIPPRVPPFSGEADAAVLRAVQRLYTIGLKPEWWKLAPMQPSGWQALATLVAARDPTCRGAVILGLNQPLADLARGFAAAKHPIVKGFMVGRSLWVAPATAWLRGEIADDAFIAAVAANFEALVDAWRASRPATPPDGSRGVRAVAAASLHSA